ncbi:hypothetical protein EHS25_009010 [Saitozyma podzolica]|uniref:Major facilitator superfamily (MFS) profile domain-containing protein n=1 Tax=Saitozyma podzolica TaxID=1890683 RepID=A0A427YKT4_9TREE|nr:hypothetical protein EHS25_009010 [Saitozyma podzolica]
MSDPALDIPGTTRILDERGEVIGSGAGAITLVPTPSSDPEDPLNWSQSRKNIHLACVILYTAATALFSSALYSIYAPLSDSTGLSIDQLNVGTGYSYLFIGLGTLIFQPAALAFGKRPVYLVTSLVTAALNIWTVFVQGNGQWIARCLLLGLFGAPNFSLIEVSIADLFFYHERSWPMGIYVCLLYAGACLGPLLSGYVFEGMGWQAVIYLSSGLMAIVFLILFIFLEETNYMRETPPLAASHQVAETSASVAPEDGEKYTDTKQPSAETTLHVPIHIDDRITTSWHGPRPFTFVKVSPHAGGIMWRGLVQPLALFRQPVIIWCGVMYGVYQIYYNRKSQIPTVSPRDTPDKHIGLTFLSPMLATIPGAVLGGFFTDKYTLHQARKNNGISEAEHKLKLFIFPTILTPIGLLMIGLGPYYNAHWMVFVVGEWILNLAGPLATLLVLTYAFDTYHAIQPRDRTGVHAAVQDCAPYLLAIIVIGMIVTFAFNYAITPWAFEWGFFNFAISAACIATAFNLTVLLMLKWGKYLRRTGESYYFKVINW